jgi:hypothetical protein
MKSDPLAHAPRIDRGRRHGIRILTGRHIRVNTDPDDARRAPGRRENMVAVNGSRSDVDTAEFLREHRIEIVEEAEGALARLGARHYQSAGETEVHRRLEALFDQLSDSLDHRDLAPMVAYAESVAEERFNAGYDLSEVQAAFNALEESIWTRATATLEPGRLAQTLGLVSTILGCGKDALARKYVSLATRTHTPSLDLRALFRGSEGT